MASDRQVWFRLPARVRVLLAVFVGLLLLLVWYRHNLTLSYQLSATKELLRSRDFPAAIEVLQKAPTIADSSGEWHYLLARSYRRAGRSGEVQVHLDRARRLGWSQQDLEREELLLIAQTGQIERVRRELDAHMQGEIPDEVAEEIYEAMAKGFLNSFDVPEATKCLKFWSQFQSDNAVPHLWMADLCERLENPSGAAAEYSKALEVDPHHPEARRKLAQALLVQLKLDEAFSHYQQCLADSPESPDVLLGMSEVLRRRGLTEESKLLLYDALVLDLRPDQAADALAALGQMALEDRKYDAAVQLLEQAVTLSPLAPIHRIVLATALASAGQESLAASQREIGVKLRQYVDRHKDLVRRLAAKPRDVELRCQIGLNLMDQGMASAGADWIKTALRIDPQSAGAHHALAKYYQQIGNQELAERHERLASQADSAMTKPKDADHG
jgi:Tfp pilus assembly protein PilF